MLEKINQTAEYLRSRVEGEMPKIAIILGTGLGPLVDHIDDKLFIPYPISPSRPSRDTAATSSSDASAAKPSSPCRAASTTTRDMT